MTALQSEAGARPAPLPPASVAMVLGTRPEIVKFAGIVRLLGASGRIIYTGQHYDDALGPVFFREFGIEPPAVSFAVGGQHRGIQIGEAVSAITQHLLEDPADVVLVQGDTNAALAGALAANALDIPLLHVEAGLRSGDRRMPEEHNRRVIDHLADRCLAPTSTSAANLMIEGIPLYRIRVTGNTVVEAVQRLLPNADERAAILHDFDVEAAGYVVATLHRPENTDDPTRLAAILADLRKLPLTVILPLHPRTAARIDGWGMQHALSGLRVTGPAAYRAFLGLAAEAAFLVSDSGGLQEEASVFKRPVAVVRTSTERPEVLGTFSTLVAPGELAPAVAPWLADLHDCHESLARLPSPYGAGAASAHCVEEVRHVVLAVPQAAAAAS